MKNGACACGLLQWERDPEFPALNIKMLQSVPPD